MNTVSVGNHFAVAPWPTALKVISTLGTVVLAGAGVIAYRAIPVPAGFTHSFGLAVALVFPAIVIGAWLLMVTGYDVTPSDLYVQRPLWYTRIGLAGLAGVWHDPGVCRRSLRVLGNGGLFSFTGIYWNPALGRYRLYATDVKRAVALVVGKRTVVVTPADPDALVGFLSQLFPGAGREAPRAPTGGGGAC